MGARRRMVAHPCVGARRHMQRPTSRRQAQMTVPSQSCQESPCCSRLVSQGGAYKVLRGGVAPCKCKRVATSAAKCQHQTKHAHIF